MTFSHTRRWAACSVALVAVTVVAGCGDDDDGGRREVSASDLNGHSYLSVGAEGIEIVADSTITVAFTGKQISVGTGCNTLTGEFTVEDGKLNTGDLAATMMACDDALMAQETWVTELISSDPTLDLSGNQLEISNGDNSLSLTEVA